MAGRETILITGANGFIGGWLAEALHLSGAAHVRVGIRNWSKAARLGRFRPEIVLCDVMDPSQVDRALAGITHVVHCAKGSRQVNITGTANVLAGALARGVRRFVHLSTTEVYGDQVGDIDECWPYQYTGRAYGDSKIEAEKLCWEYCSKGLPVTVLRPSIVYGPFSTEWTARLAYRLQSGDWGVFSKGGDGFCNLVYIADLLAGIMRAMRDDRAIGEALNLSGPELVTWNEYFRRFANALGLPDLRTIDPGRAQVRAHFTDSVKAPVKFARDRFAGPLKVLADRSGLVKHVTQHVEKTMKTTPSLSDLELFGRRARYLADKAEWMIGYRPQYDLQSGLRLAIGWLDLLGLTPSGQLPPSYG